MDKVDITHTNIMDKADNAYTHIVDIFAILLACIVDIITLLFARIVDKSIDGSCFIIFWILFVRAWVWKIKITENLESGAMVENGPTVVNWVE